MIVLDCISGVLILQNFMIGLQSKKIHSKFISQSPLRRMPNAKDMFVMLTAIFAIGISYILQNIMVVIEKQTVYLVIPVVMGIPVYVYLSFINLLVIGSPCNLLSKVAENIINKEENDVSELVLLYKMYHESVSFHLFVTYSLSTVQLIVFLYMCALTMPCFHAPVSNQLKVHKRSFFLYLFINFKQVVWTIIQISAIVGLCILLLFIGKYLKILIILTVPLICPWTFNKTIYSNMRNITQ